MKVLEQVPIVFGEQVVLSKDEVIAIAVALGELNTSSTQCLAREQGLPLAKDYDNNKLYRNFIELARK